MMELPDLGRLERLKLRDVWRREDTVFTPWLARPENLQLVADAIGVPELELIQTEQQVSEFSLDIIARVAGSDQIVAIENQIEPSDHRHLGQSIVYAAGTAASVVVWIAEQFTEGHRAALDWLNRVTTDDIVFFGIEVEVWRIGDSAPAPKLSVVARPNAWVRVARRQAAAPGGSAEGDQNSAYWAHFLTVAARDGLPLSSKATRARSIYLYLGDDRKNIAVVGYLSRATKAIGAYLGFYGSDASTVALSLERHRGDIEAALGATFRLTDRGKASVWIDSIAKLDADVDEPTDWPRQHEWLAREMQRLRRIFEPLLAKAGAFSRASPGEFPEEMGDAEL